MNDLSRPELYSVLLGEYTQRLNFIGCFLLITAAISATALLIALPWFPGEHEARETLKHSSLSHRLLAMDMPLAPAVCAMMCTLRPALMSLMPFVVRDVPDVVAKDVLRHTWSSYSRTLQNVIFKAETTAWAHRIEQEVLLTHHDLRSAFRARGQDARSTIVLSGPA